MAVKPKNKTWWKITLLCPPEIREWIVAVSGLFSSRGIWEKKEELLFFFDHPARLKAFREYVISQFSKKVKWGEVRSIPDKDWNESWKKNFKTQHINPGMVIRPPWQKYLPQKNEIVITIDPGMAFGTGTHETTKLVLRKLSKLPLVNKTILDLGCGSGILTIASLLFGAGRVTGLDNDPLAIEESRKNANLNQLPTGKYRLIEGTIHDLPRQKFDIIVANIQSGVLIPILPKLKEICQPEGLILFSGILNEEEKEFSLRLRSGGFTIQKIRRLKGWVCFEARIHHRSI